MPQEVLPNIHLIEVPIPHSPLRATNAYFIHGAERSLLVDTGQNRPESLEALRRGLHDLSADLCRTDVFLTHMHADHSGLLPFIASTESAVYASAPDAEIVNYLLTTENPLERLYHEACRNGFTPEEANKALSRHPGNIPGDHHPMHFTTLADGDRLDAGGYSFLCVATPGHTAGHLCLYEPEKRILLSGDHILGDISPNITHYYGENDPLTDFLASLEKIARLDVERVLPGHRRAFGNCRERIAELVSHHKARAAEVLEILEAGPLTGYEVAARMTWDMVYRTWKEVAPTQKFFATGEALAHIHYLEHQGLICRTGQNDRQVRFFRP